MAEIFDRQFDRENEQREPWYLRTAINAGIIGGMAFGIPKMKGPVAKLVNGINTTQTLQEAQKEVEKMNRDSFRESQQNMDLDFTIKNKFIDPINMLPDIDHPSVNTAHNIINDTERLETSVLQYGDEMMKREYGPRFKNEASPAFDIMGDMEDGIALKSNRGEYFAQLRHETIMDFLAREPLLRGESRPAYSYGELLESGANPDKISQAHDYYMRNSPEYAHLYKTKVNRLERELSNFAGTTKRKHPKIKTKTSFKDYIQNGKFDATKMGEAETRAAAAADQADRVKKTYGGVVPDRQGVKQFDLLAEFKGKLLEDRNRWTSKSHNFVFTGDKLFDQVGEFDYTGEFKRLASTLEKLKDDASSPIEDAKLHLEHRGDYQYAVMKLQIADQQDMIEFAIPISRDGKMPGKSRSSTPRLDAFFTKGDDLALSPEKGIQINKSQEMIRKITNILDSSFSNKIGSDPAGATRTIRRIITSSISELPLFEGYGEMRDVAKLLAIHNDTLINITKSGKEKSIMLKEYMRNSEASSHNINNIVKAKRAGRKVVGIGFDLETIGYRDLGPTAQARDLRTQVHTTSISTINFTNKGNIVSDTETLVSDHVIDYLNKNDGWNRAKGDEGNIPWIRQLLDLPKDAEDVQVKEAFTNYLRRKSKGNFARSKDNREYMNKVADQLIAKIRNATQNGDTDVFLLTKNGTAFDMKILDAIVPDKAAEIRKLAPHIDTQSVAYSIKEGNFGDESLRLKSLLQKMLGRMGLDPNIDIEAEGGFKRFTEEIRKKKVNGYTLLDFSSDVENKMKELFNQKAHESPDVDNIGNFALVSKWISEAESGASHFSTDHLSSLGKLIAMGDKPLSLEESQYIFQLLMRQKTKYGHVVDPSFATSNMLSKGIMSMMDFSLMTPFPNIQRNKDVHQLFRGKSVFGLSSKYKQMMGKGLDKKANLMFESPLVTKNYKKVESWLMGAHDKTNQFSKHVTLNTFFTWGAWAGREGMDNISVDAAKKIAIRQRSAISLNEVTFEGAPQLANDLKEFERKVRLRAIELAKNRTRTDNARPTIDDYDQAGREVAQLKSIEIPVSSAHELAQGDFGVKTAKAEMAGKIVGVSIDEDMINPHAAPVIKAQVEYLSTLDKVKGGTARGYGSKAAFTITNAKTYGADSYAAADFITKGYAGSAKQILLMKSIDKLRREVIDGGEEGKAAQKKLTKLATQMKAEWTGTQMITGDDVNAMDFKYGKSAAEKDMIKRWLGSTPMSFSDVLNTISETGFAWKNEQELAVGFYQQWVGWQGTAHRTIAKGQEFTRRKAASAAEKALKGWDDATTEVGAMMQQIDPALRTRIKGDITQFYNTLFVPEVHGPKIGEFRTPEGLAPTKPGEKNIFQFGIIAPDQKALYDINEGKSLKRTPLKIRSGVMDILKAGNETVSSSTINDIERQLKVNFSRQHRDAHKKLSNFFTQLMSKASTKGQLSLSDIDILLDRKDQANLGKNAIKELSGMSKEAIRNRLRQLEFFNNMPEEEMEREITSIISELEIEEISKRITDPESPWMSTTELHKWSEMAEKYSMQGAGDVFRVKTGLEEGLTIDFQELRRLSDQRYPMTQTEIDSLMAQFKNFAARAQEQQGTGKSFIKKIIDTTEDGHRVQQVVLDEIILPAFSRPDNMANMVTNSLGRGMDHTLFTRKILTHVRNLDKAIKNKGDVKTAAHLISKNYVDFFRRGLPISHKGLFGGAFSYEPIGKMGPVVGAEVVHENARRLKETMRNMDKKTESKLDQILKSDASTAFISKSHLESMPIRLSKEDQIRLGFDANEIKYKQYLEKEVGTDQALQILSGEKAAPGYHIRYPLEQQGTDSVLDMKFLSIDDAFGKELGMDGNSVYTNFLTMIQNEDYDSDRGAIALKLLSVADKNLKGEDAYRHIMDEHDRALPHLLARPDVDINNKARVMSYKGAGKVEIAKWDQKGNLDTKIVNWDSAEAKDAQVGVFQGISKIARNIAIDSPDIINPNMVKSRFDVGVFNAMMKDQIGVATNMLGRQMHHVMQAGTIKDPLVSKFLVGNLAHGLPNVGQEFMGFGKHGMESSIAKFTKVSEQLMNPGTASLELRDFLKSTFGATMIEQADEEGKFWGRDPKQFAEQVADEFLRGAEARRIAIGGDPAKKAQLNALDKIAIGHKGTSGVDLGLALSANEEDLINKAIYRNLSETGFHVDLSDATPSKPLVSELGERLAKKFNISDLGQSAIKKSGKYGAIGAAIFMGLNFFRPNQMSDSMNPLDGFVDLGTDIDGNHRRVGGDLQLARRLPIEMTNASFSKEAFIRMQSNDRQADTNKRMASTVRNLLELEQSDQYEFRKFQDKSSFSYNNYTSHVGFVGSANLDRKSKL